MHSEREVTRSLLADVVLGAAAGIVGTVVMGKVTTFLYRFESDEKKRREEEARDEPPFQVLAGRLVEGVGLDVTDERKQKTGMALHWGYGMAWGALYGVLRHRMPWLSRAMGLPFAVGFSLVGDEILNTVMGLTAPPRAFPVEAHLRGLAGHVAFTAAAEAGLRAGDAARDVNRVARD